MMNMQENRKVNLYSFDIRTGKKEVYSLNSFFTEEERRTINNLSERIGVKFIIEEVKDTERFVETYFSKDGFKVIRPSPYHNSHHSEFEGDDKFEIIKFLEDNYKIKKDFNTNLWSGFLVSSGVPDFLVYKLLGKKVIDLFFIEVKF